MREAMNVTLPSLIAKCNRGQHLGEMVKYIRLVNPKLGVPSKENINRKMI
jgi:hypothetical protein